MGKSSGWNIALAERIAHVACAKYGLNEPSLIRFSESAVFRSDGVILRIDQGRPGRFSGDALRRVVAYMDDIGVKTTPTAGLETLGVENINVTFYEFVPKAHEPDWHQTVKGFGEQVRFIHDLADASMVARLAPSGVELDFVHRKASEVTSKLHGFLLGGNSCLAHEQVELLYDRAVVLAASVMETSTAGDGRDSPQVVLHGDAHFGNIHATDTEVLVVDFEEVGFGAPFLDHLNVLLADRLFDTQMAYGLFSEGYGADLSGEEGLGEWLELTALVYTSWAAGLGRVSGPHREEALRRFSFWEEGLHLGDLTVLSKRDVPYLWNVSL